MDVAFALPGGAPVFTFTLLVSLGAGVGMLWAVGRAPKESAEAVFAAGVWALLGALVVARAAYIAIHWAYFRAHLLLIPQVWLGGMSGSAALPGALLGLALAARRRMATWGEALLPLLFTVAVSAWLGCWTSGVFYGPVTGAWWGVPTRDEWGELALRVPLQWLAALSLLGVAWGLEQARGRGWLPSPEATLSLGVGGTALVSAVAALLRADPVPRLYGLPYGFWLTALLAAGAFLYALWTWSEAV